MANVRISDLTAVVTPADTDEVEVNQSGTSKKATRAQLRGTNAEIETAYNAQVAAASQAEAEAGTETAIRRWSPLRIAQAIAALAAGGGTWGSITGTLSAQTDLQAALDAKADDAHTHVIADITDAGTLAAKSTVESADIGAGEVTKEKLAAGVFEDDTGVKTGTATDEAINAARLRYFAGLYWPIDSRTAGQNFTEILDAHAGALIKTDRNMTLDNAFASQQTFTIWNVHSASVTLTVEAGAGGTGVINGGSSITISAGGLVVVVVESNAGDEPQGAAFGDLSPLDLPAGTTLDSEEIVTAEGAQLVAADANNDLTVNPPFWVGTETEYGGLTPTAGTLYFVKADP